MIFFIGNNGTNGANARETFIRFIKIVFMIVKETKIAEPYSKAQQL
jgi:hypothetical protein